MNIVLYFVEAYLGKKNHACLLRGEERKEDCWTLYQFTPVTQHIHISVTIIKKKI